MLATTGGNELRQAAAEAVRPGDVGATALETHRLLILSDIRFLREGLAEVLARDGAFSVAGTTAHVDEALAMVRTAPARMILIDAAMPDGIAAARRMHAVDCWIRVVALALAETEADVVAWAGAGATGYVPRSVALNELVLFLQRIVRGEQPCSPQVAGGLLRWVSDTARAQAQPPAVASELTAREHQIVGLIVVGCSNKEIARRLNIGVATVKSHVHNILGKLGVERRGQMVGWWREHAGEVDRGGLAKLGRYERASPPRTPSSGTRTMDIVLTQSG